MRLRCQGKAGDSGTENATRNYVGKRWNEKHIGQVRGEVFPSTPSYLLTLFSLDLLPMLDLQPIQPFGSCYIKNQEDTGASGSVGYFAGSRWLTGVSGGLRINGGNEFPCFLIFDRRKWVPANTAGRAHSLRPRKDLRLELRRAPCDFVHPTGGSSEVWLDRRPRKRQH